MKAAGADAYLYCICALPSLPGAFATGGEDRALRVWRVDSAEPVFEQRMPKEVWDVCAAPNGDVACAASDGVARVFTLDQTRIADAQTIENFEAQVKEVMNFKKKKKKKKLLFFSIK